MSHTDLAIRDQIQALELTLFRISVTAKLEQKLPIKIPLKPMKTVAHAIDKVKYLRFSRSKGYHIGLIPVEPSIFAVLETPQAQTLIDALHTLDLAYLYLNPLNDTVAQIWLAQDFANETLFNHLQQASIGYRLLNVAQGEAALAGFVYPLP